MTRIAETTNLLNRKWARPDRPAWIAAKSAGDTGERLAASVFCTLGLIVNQILGNGSHDLEVNGRIEIKTDRLAERTGNVAIEVEHRGSASGITNSTATAWGFVVGSQLIVTPTEKLRALICEREFPRVSAGESATVLLVPVDEIRRIGRNLQIRGPR